MTTKLLDIPPTERQQRANAYDDLVRQVQELQTQRQAALDMCEAVDRKNGEHGTQHILSDLVAVLPEHRPIPWTLAVRIALGDAPVNP